MRAVVYDAAEEFSVREVGESPLAAGEVRLKVLASGVCGTDQHIHVGGFGARFPVTPGHEMVGEVIEVHPTVTGWALGTRAVVDNVLVCGHCNECQDGRFGLCENLEAYGLTHQGSVAETLTVPASACVPIGDLDVETAVLAEPLACVIHGMDVLRLKPASDVLIVGAGPTGQLLSQALRHGGASRVVLAAPTKAKLDVAARNGVAESVVTDRRDLTASYPRFRELAPHGFDVVVDATGASGVVNALLPLVRSGGTLMIYGMAAEDARLEVSPYEIFRRELTVKGSFAQKNCVARAVAMLRHGLISPEGIVTHRFGLDEYREALDALRDPGCLKAVIFP